MQIQISTWTKTTKNKKTGKKKKKKEQSYAQVSRTMKSLKTYIFEDFLCMVGKIALGKRIRWVALKIAGVADQVNTAST